MRVIRFEDEHGEVCYGVPQTTGTAHKVSGDIFGKFTETNEESMVAKLLAPIVPSQVFCIGLNYRFQAKECGLKEPEFPVLFMKGINALQNPYDPIVIPRTLASAEVDYEAELAVVIGRDCKNVTQPEALDYVLGYCCANDVSARDWQLKKGGGQWCRGKTFDTFLPLGPALVLNDEIPDPGNLCLRCVVNDIEVQNWTTEDMIFSVPQLIEFLSASTTLKAGTVILTGTPHGVGMSRQPPLWLKAGDVVTVTIDGIGALTNPVVEEVLSK